MSESKISKPNIIKITRSSVPGKTPNPEDLEYGQLAINFNDEKLFFKNSKGNISYFSPVNCEESETPEIPEGEDEVECTYNIPLFDTDSITSDNKLSVLKTIPNSGINITVKLKRDAETGEITQTFSINADSITAKNLEVDNIKVKENAEIPEVTSFIDTNENGETVLII